MTSRKQAAQELQQFKIPPDLHSQLHNLVTHGTLLAEQQKSVELQLQLLLVGIADSLLLTRPIAVDSNSGLAWEVPKDGTT